MSLIPSLMVFAIGFIPAMLVLHRVVKPYEDMVPWERVYTFTFIGIVAGIFIAAFHLIVEVGAGRDLGSLMIIEGVLAFVEQGAVMVVFNLPRFQRRWDTPFYAAGFGSGVAAMIFLARMYPFTSVFEPAGGVLPWGIVLQALLLSLMLAFMFPTATSFIAYGSFRGRVIPYYLGASMLQWACYTLISPAFVQDPASPDMGLILGASAGASVLAGVGFLFALGGVFPACAANRGKRDPAG